MQTDAEQLEVLMPAHSVAYWIGAWFIVTVVYFLFLSIVVAVRSRREKDVQLDPVGVMLMYVLFVIVGGGLAYWIR